MRGLSFSSSVPARVKTLSAYFNSVAAESSIACAACSGVSVPAKIPWVLSLMTEPISRGQRLIIVQLEVLCIGEAFLERNHQRIGHSNFTTLDNRDGNIDFDQFLLCFCV